MSARERDRQARVVPPLSRVLGLCCGCDKPITKGLLRNHLAIKIGDSFMCNECEGGSDV